MSGDDSGTTAEDASVQWSCNRKKAYPTEAIARSVARGVRERSGAFVVAYACLHCGRWHVGRKLKAR